MYLTIGEKITPTFHYSCKGKIKAPNKIWATDGRNSHHKERN